MRSALLICLALLCACRTVPSAVLHSSKASSNPQLVEVADRFYAAPDVAALKTARDEALQLSPKAALAHELAAQYAMLEGNDAAATEHLMSALADTDSPDALLYLKLLYGFEWSDDQARRAEALLSALSTEHPSPEVRAYAAFRLTLIRREFGMSNVKEAEARINGTLQLAAIGPWDNDQGKGFEMPQPPESAPLDFNAEYPGVQRPVRWRNDLVAAPAGGYYLSEQLEPSRFTLAYATGAFRLSQPAKVELRLRTSEPFKVWVDGALVASVREVREVMFDQAVIPLSLPPGDHRVLIKSARRESGAWILAARLTGQSGARLDGLSLLSPTQNVSPAKLQVKAPLKDDLVSAKLSALTKGTVRAHALTALWSRHAAGGIIAVREAEKFTAASKDSVYAQWLAVMALWSNGEQGRASDVLAPLTTKAGALLPGISSAQARLWVQQGLRQKARAALVELNTRHPMNPAVLRELAYVFDLESWHEDACATRADLLALSPGGSSQTVRRASCLRQLGKFEQAEALYQQQLKLTPGDEATLREYMGWALERGRDATAEWAAREYLARNPSYRSAYLSLAVILERREAYDEAAQTLRGLMALSPESAAPWNALAGMEYRRGNKQAAITAWREALARNPDDEKLANRVEFLSPLKQEPWMADVPDEAALDALVAHARSLKPQSGANYAFVLDQEVAEYKPDGTVVALVTEVLQSFNAEGRDVLLKRGVGGGRVRIRVAYAVDSDGRRIEPASVRDGQVRFRSLGERSTVVLQYRRDSPPRGYLARQLNYSWTFQGLNDQRERAQFILYLPKTVGLHEWLRGKVERTEREVGELRRLEWMAKDVLPAGYEAGMPTVSEVTSALMLSSIDSWDTFNNWTQALFEDAMRESPEIKQLAATLFEGAEGTDEKLMRIQSFMMKEIRYQQDYESMIAGVKPHPAPMTLERKYGDCKDKTVLFMTLARMAGIQTNYALIRTRDAGPVKSELPQQQFNHVIVYVPQQPGLAHERYFDPTADALDLVTLRTDVVGTRSFVLDPVKRTWSWRDIPFQSSDANSQHAKVDVTLDDEGAGTVTLRQALVGTDASSVRRLGRNKEHFSRLMQHVAAAYFAGSEVRAVPETPNPDDVRNPAQFAIELAARTAAKKEGQTLRLSLPRDVSPMNSFKLSQRKHPLVLNVPRRYRWSGKVSLANATVLRAPKPVSFKSTCLDYTRTVAPVADGLQYNHHTEFKCERVDPSSYPDVLKAAVEVQRLMEEDVVFAVGKKGKVLLPKVKTVTRPDP